MRELDIDVGSCRLHLRESGSGFPILLGHSLSFDSKMWEAQRRALEDRYRVIAVDLRGHGDSLGLGVGRSVPLMGSFCPTHPVRGW